MKWWKGRKMSSSGWGKREAVPTKWVVSILFSSERELFMELGETLAK